MNYQSQEIQMCQTIAHNITVEWMQFLHILLAGLLEHYLDVEICHYTEAVIQRLVSQFLEPAHD